MSAWDNLSIRDKAEMMKVAIGNGITNINDIKREYNEFAQGGNIYAMGTPLTEEQRRALARQYFWENKMDKAQQYAVPSIYEGEDLPEVSVTAERLPFEYQNVAPTDNTFVAGTGRTQNPQAMQRAIQGGEQLNAWHESHPVLSTVGTVAGAAPLAVASYPVASYPIAALGDAAYAAGTTPLIMEGMNVPFAASGLDNLAHGNADWQTALEISPLGKYAKPLANSALHYAGVGARHAIAHSNVGKRAIEVAMRTGVGANPLEVIHRGTFKRIPNKRKFDIAKYILTGKKGAPGYNNLEIHGRPYQGMFGNLFDTDPQYGDVIDAFLWKKELDPRIGTRVPGSPLGVHEGYVKKHYPNKQPQVYELNIGNKYTQKTEKIAADIDAGRIKPVAEQGVEYDMPINYGGYGYDAAGHLRTFYGPNKEFVREQDIWKFKSSDYMKKWKRQLIHSSTSPLKKRFIKWGLDTVDEAGTPIIMRSPVFDLTKDPDFPYDPLKVFPTKSFSPPNYFTWDPIFSKTPVSDVLSDGYVNPIPEEPTPSWVIDDDAPFAKGGRLFKIGGPTKKDVERLFWENKMDEAQEALDQVTNTVNKELPEITIFPERNQGEITPVTGNALSRAIDNYTGELKYDLANGRVPGGKYTLPAAVLGATGAAGLATAGDMAYTAGMTLNGFTGLEKPAVYDRKAVEAYNHMASDNVYKNFDSKTLDKAQPYVVNMYYNNSPALEDAYNNGKGVTGTHTGILTYDNDKQKWVVTHNIHGKIHQENFVPLQNGKGKYGVTAIYQPREDNLVNRVRGFFGFANGGRLYDDGGKKKPLHPNVGRAMQYFIDRGLADYQAAGLVGNLMRESSMSPTARNKWSGAYGLAQWLGDRRTNLFSKYGENPTFDQQLDYIWHELNSTHKNGLKNILASKTAEEAAMNAMGYYEFSAGPEGAIRAMNKYGQDGEGSMRKGIEFANSLMGYYPNAGQAPVIQQPQQPDPYAYQQQILDSLNSLSNAFNTLAPAVLSYKSQVKTPHVQEIPEEPKFNPASLLTQYQMLDSVL